MGYVEEWLKNDVFRWAADLLNGVLAADIVGTRDELGRVERILKDLKAQHPDEPILLNAEGRLADARDRLGEAWDWYGRAQHLTTPGIYASPWLNEAKMYRDFSFVSKAIALYRQVLQSDPGDAAEEEARKWLGACEKYRTAITEKYRLTSNDVAGGDRLVLSTLEVLLAIGFRITGVKCRVKDHVGCHREVDILTERTPPLDFLDPLPIVIECKDWSRPVDRSVVDKYVSLITHSPYKLCIIVARAFTQPARQAAEANGIWLLSSDELESSAECMLRARLNAGPVFTQQRVLRAGGIAICATRDRAELSEEERQQRRRTTNRLTSLLDCSGRSPGVRIEKEGVSIEGEIAAPVRWNRDSHLTKAISSLGQLPLLAQLLLLDYAEGIHTVAR